jgi:hypothetical protein
MTREEYVNLFHQAEVNLVAFKQVNDCDEELRKMVEMAIEAERTWVGLTDEDDIDWDGGDLKSLVRAVEAKLKEKNT